MDHVRSSNCSKAILRLPIENKQDLAQTSKIIPILNALQGVFSVEINHVTNMISIEYDAQKITLEEIRSKIRETISHRSSTDLT
jgi:hypothetical protein